MTITSALRIGRTMLAAALALSCACGQPARAADDDSGPFWASLRKDQANMRVGPGRDYRISWIYVRGGVPVKVLRAREGWVLVEDQDGARGWMLTQFVTRKVHTGVVKGGPAEIRENKDGSGRLLWRAAPGVVGRLGDCAGGWCKVDIDGRQGFVSQTAMWGAGAP
ncbi:SH3 domain-containing protein [Novosphingobium sp.]|uniref:SH3 domain-containing protein n=1 Tax=Novosphingobium sp. TaxID=1874826 RepID=UPI0038BDE587